MSRIQTLHGLVLSAGDAALEGDGLQEEALDAALEGDGLEEDWDDDLEGDGLEGDLDDDLEGDLVVGVAACASLSMSKYSASWRTFSSSRR